MTGVDGVLQQSVGVSFAMFSTPCVGIEIVFLSSKEGLRAVEIFCNTSECCNRC